MPIPHVFIISFQAELAFEYALSIVDCPSNGGRCQYDVIWLRLIDPVRSQSILGETKHCGLDFSNETATFTSLVT